MTIHNHHKGFTLIETIIYMALIMFVIGAGVTSAFYLIDSSEKDNSKTNTLIEAEFILRKIDWVLTGVDSINLPLLGGSGPTLSVNKDGADIIINILGTKMQMDEGAGPISLNRDRVKITHILFNNVNGPSPKPDAIKVSFTMDGKNFEMIKYLRK